MKVKCKMKCLWRETSLVRSVLEYAAPVWAGLPSYLSDLVESKRSTENHFPDTYYCQVQVCQHCQSAAIRPVYALSRIYLYHLFFVWQACFPHEKASTVDLVFGQVLLDRSQISIDSSVQTGSPLSSTRSIALYYNY